ncbi:amidase [Microdochium nivale]|nr:amidase [Microdochium nivale]
MGCMANTGMPVNLTFASRAHENHNLTKCAYAFEQAGAAGAVCQRRVPGLTPKLLTDITSGSGPVSSMSASPPQLEKVKAAV